MKTSQKIKYTFATLLFVCASLSLSLSNAQFASAVASEWTGAGDGSSFSDVDNWSAGAAPQDGDVVTFDITGVGSNVTITNDLVDLSLDGIVFTGIANSNYSYIIRGNEVTLNGDVQNAISGSQADRALPVLENDIVLSADITINKVTIGKSGTQLNLQTHSLAYAGSVACGLSLSSNISGSGALSLVGSKINITGSNAAYTGAILVTGSARATVAALGSASVGTNVSGSGSLGIVYGGNQTLTEPLTLGGSGFIGSSSVAYSCIGISYAPNILTVAGGVTLTSDFRYQGKVFSPGDNTPTRLVVSDSYTKNGYVFSVASGSNGVLQTRDGEFYPPEETIAFNGDVMDFEFLYVNQTGILNGSRIGIGVYSGGILKGGGSVQQLIVFDGGIVNPGSSPGTIVISDAFTAGGTYRVEIRNSEHYDQLIVGESYSGGDEAVTLNESGKDAVLDVDLLDSSSVVKSDTFTIIDNRSATMVNGTFEGLAEAAQITVDGVTFSISYVGGDGNDVVLTALNSTPIVATPTAPNTGVFSLAQKNPAVVVGLAVLTVLLGVAIAIRRHVRNTHAT